MKLYDKVQQRGTKKHLKDFEDIIQPAIERFKEIQDYESHCRPLMLRDRAFDDGDQWEKADRDQREIEKRPCLTIPRTNQFSDRLKNEQAQAKPAVKITPVDDGADEKAAENRQGLIRHIQYTSRAQMARQHAFNCGITEGRGHWRVTTEYAHDASFDQNVIVDLIKDPLNVYMDWRHQKPDYSDSRYGFIVDRMSKKEFEKEYPKALKANWYECHEDNDWNGKDDVLVAEYYCRKEVDRELLLLERNGEQIKVYKDQLADDEEIQPNEIINKRTVTEYRWHWYKLTSVEILDHRELPGVKTIPIMTTIGKETVIRGKLNIKGIIRDLIDSQKMYNYWASQETEWVSMAPRAPFVGAEGQFEGYEDVYANANSTTHAFLPYKPVSHSGQLVPPPQRSMPPTIPAGIVQAKQEIIEDMKAITGIYDASLGARSNETSGVAIRQREVQGDTASFHFVDHFRNALEHEGRVENDLLSIYYTDDRRVQILRDNDETEELNLGEIDKGERVTLGDGEYGVRVEVGPSFTTARQEASANMIELAGKIPALGQAAGDLAVKMFDFPNKDEIAERLKRIEEMQFPGLTAPIEEQGEDNEQAMLQQQIAQLTQQVQQMLQEREQMVQEMQKLDATKVNNEAQKNEIEARKLELEEQKMINQMDLDKAKLEMQAMIADLQAETNLKIEEMRQIGDVSKIDRQATYKFRELAATPKQPEKPDKEQKSEPSVVNVQVDATKNKEALIEKLPNGSYKVTQKATE